MHRLETLDNILSDEVLLHQATKKRFKQFKYLLDEFSTAIKKRSDAPLFFEDRVDPGNRCKLHKRHVLLLELMKKRLGLSQYGLMIFFGVNQSTISRYHKFANSVLAEILPTAEKITKLIQKNAPGTIKELVPDKTLIIDGSHVEIQRPTYKDARKTYYSGKKKRHSINTTVVTTTSGLILATGKSAQGSMHDITMFCEDNIKLGPLTARHEEQKDKEKRQGYNIRRSWIFRNQRRPTRCQRHATNKKIKEQKADTNKRCTLKKLTALEYA